MTVGYSSTPLQKKLGIKPGMSIALLHAPPEVETTLGELPEGVITSRRLTGHRDLVLIFITRQVDLASQIPALTSAIAPNGMIWVAWPKRASKIDTDMTEDAIRDIVLPSSGLVDVKVCAIDQVWSGLKLVIRKTARRASESR
jgi:exosome complex RNA-binding protein Rrp4